MTQDGRSSAFMNEWRGAGHTRVDRRRVLIRMQAK